ncbi:Hypothetical protein SRAE_X000245300 [Strongyloides ratti]|uniref:RIC3 domain-containing protein n=1 Tax=Strongyloides ratti TaxID=34506 RepID=A0A090KTB7_STRRB|nr:Hypothetical protein SRAE_X000245300 [Strongyloides ratti]CEF60720.1 Hypothetical protein SRAE_X000245300 [Strongyloides ratti]
MENITKKKFRDHNKQSSKYLRQRNLTKEKHFIENCDEEEVMPSWKIFMIIGIVVLCFAILYPHIIGPIFNSYFSSTSSQKKPSTPPISPVHPALNNPRAGGPRPGGPNMHSAFKMAGQAQQTETSSIRGGAFGWLLPFYTIGVMTFLVYTLYKMMYGGKEKKNKRKYQRNVYDSDFDDESYDDDDDIDNMSSRKMRRLQCQLKETEAAMTKILLQLENMQNMEMVVRQTMEINKNNSNNNANEDNVMIEEESSLQERLTNNADEIKKTLNKFHLLNKYYTDLKQISNQKDLKRMNVDGDYSSNDENSDEEDDFENFTNTSNESVENNKNTTENNEIEEKSLNKDNESDNTNNDIENENISPLENNKTELSSMLDDDKNTLIEKNHEINTDEINDNEKLSNNNKNINNVTKISRKEKKKKHSRREK